MTEPVGLVKCEKNFEGNTRQDDDDKLTYIILKMAIPLLIAPKS